MAKSYITAGMRLLYAAESTAGTRPTTWTMIPDEIKTMPSLNFEPQGVPATPLGASTFKYIDGLRDPGGNLSYEANYTDDLETAWAACVSAYDALTGGKEMWFCHYHPKFAKSVYFKGKPVAMSGWDEAAVGEVTNVTLYIAPQSEATLDTKPTIT